MIWMPGQSYRQALPPLSATELKFQDRLKRDVEALDRARHQITATDFLTTELEQAGYTVHPQKYSIATQTFSNLEVEIPGSSRADEILVIGGHYGSTVNSPGPEERVTGAAAVLALAREFVGKIGRASCRERV